MIIDIYELFPDGSLDTEVKVAEVSVEDGNVKLSCSDPSRQSLLEELFLEDLSRFVPGCDADGTERLALGSADHIQHLLDDELYGFSLGGKVRNP